MTRSIEIDTVTVTREAWLHAAIEQFRPRFIEVGFPLPERVHVSVGFGTGIRGENKVILGATWSTIAATDGVNHVFVSPVVDDTAEVLRILLHELIHVTLDNEDGHRGRFAEIATRLGFEGSMQTTPVGMSLAADLMVLADELGDYPHSRIDPDAAKRVQTPAAGGAPAPRIHTGPRTQTTRYRRVQCPVDGYTVRVTSKWLDVGFPTCPCGTEMTLNEV